MNKRQREGTFFRDITPEELVHLETILSSRPNGERTHRDVLDWLGIKLYELAAQGEVADCYQSHSELPDAMHHIPSQRQEEKDWTWADFGGAAL